MRSVRVRKWKRYYGKPQKGIDKSLSLSYNRSVKFNQFCFRAE